MTKAFYSQMSSVIWRVSDIILDVNRRLRKKVPKLMSHVRYVFAMYLSLTRVLIPLAFLLAPETVHSGTWAFFPRLSSRTSSLKKSSVLQLGFSKSRIQPVCQGLTFCWGRGPVQVSGVSWPWLSHTLESCGEVGLSPVSEGLAKWVLSHTSPCDRVKWSKMQMDCH